MLLVIIDKNVGEQNTEELSECLLNEDSRNIEQIFISDIDSTDELFDILMGTKVQPRREWLLKHAEEARV